MKKANSLMEDLDLGSLQILNALKAKAIISLDKKDLMFVSATMND